MGQAKRRKDLGIMPERTPKPHKKARRKEDPTIGMMGMGGLSMVLSSLLMSKHVGRNFAMRSELARMNREKELSNDNNLEANNEQQG